MATLNPSSIAGQMRLKTGDFSSAGDDPWLADSIYLWFYSQANNSILDGSIAALESIISQIALRPSSITNADVTESWSKNVDWLNGRLADLKAEQLAAKNGGRVPVLIRSDRRNWKDFDDLFGCR